MSEKKELNSMDILDILSALPHRYPFLLIDKIIDFQAEGDAQYLVAVKNVTFNEPHFTGHFPNNPVFPGVLILEAMAQASGVLAVESFGKLEKNELYYFVSVDDAKFRKPVVPGDQLEIRVDFQKERRGIFSFVARAKVADEVVCQAKLKVARR